MKKIASIILLIFSVSVGFSQSSKSFICKVLDSKTKEPVPFATIMLTELNRGTHADIDGFFEIPNIYEKDYSLTISSIGYLTTKVKISTLKSTETNIIYLSFADTLLDEVVIKAKKKKRKRLLAYGIVRRAIDNIPKNHPRQAFSFIGYYRDYQQPVDDSYAKFLNINDTIEYLNLHEGIIEVFDAGFGTNQLTDDRNQTAVYSFKTNNNFRVDSTITIPYDNGQKKFANTFRITPLGGNELNLLNLVNAIRNYDKMSFSFVNVFRDGFPEFHEFKVTSTQYVNGKPVYEISFETKKARNDYFANGKIYIQEDNYAIHKFTYNLFFRSRSNLKYTITSEFKEKNKQMFLNYITFNNFFIARSSDFFQVKKITLDLKSLTYKLELNKDLSEDSRKYLNRKIKVYFKNKRIGVERVKVLRDRVLMVKLKASDAYVFYKTKNEDISSYTSFKFSNIKDVNGYKLNKPVELKFNQYRELYVQEIFPFKPLQNNKVFMDKFLPLSKAKIDSTKFENEYWINSPLKRSKKN